MDHKLAPEEIFRWAQIKNGGLREPNRHEKIIYILVKGIRTARGSGMVHSKEARMITAWWLGTFQSLEAVAFGPASYRSSKAENHRRLHATLTVAIVSFMLRRPNYEEFRYNYSISLAVSS